MNPDYHELPDVAKAMREQYAMYEGKYWKDAATRAVEQERERRLAHWRSLPWWKRMWRKRP